MKEIPNLYDWAGGQEAIEKMIEIFYEKVVKDELLSPIFMTMSKKHQVHVAHFICEVFGGPKLYTEAGGSHHGMITKHLDRNISEKQRRRFVNLLLDAADEAKLPDDPEFRSAFSAYIEWGSRLAVVNSKEKSIDMDTREPMPSWGWGEVGGPYEG